VLGIVAATSHGGSGLLACSPVMSVEARANDEDRNASGLAFGGITLQLYDYTIRLTLGNVVLVK